MKLYIKSNNPSDVPSITLDIHVYLESMTSDVAAAFSNIKPVYNKQKEIDEQALADYDCFIEELLGELEYHDFQILRASESKSSVTSRYYTMANADQVKAKDIKYLIFLRVSEHHSGLDEEQKAWVRNERKKDIEKYKQPTTKKHQRFKVKEIIVNNESFASYDDALEASVIRINEWVESIK